MGTWALRVRNNGLSSFWQCFESNCALPRHVAFYGAFQSLFNDTVTPQQIIDRFLLTEFNLIVSSCIINVALIKPKRKYSTIIK